MVIQTDPRFPDTLNNRRLINEKMSRDDAAFCDYDDAIKMRPTFVDSILNRGCLFLKKAMFELARYDFNKVNAVTVKVINGYRGCGFQNPIGPIYLMSSIFIFLMMTQLKTTRFNGLKSFGSENLREPFPRPIAAQMALPLKQLLIATLPASTL